MFTSGKLFSTLACFVLLVSQAFAQSDKQRIDAYVSQYKELAMSEMLRTGVPASVTLAQGLLETAGGQSDLAAFANNHFGIKCKSEWTGERMLHNDDEKGECFRKYATVEDSFKDHSDFLKTRPCYAFLFKLDPTDYEGWAKGLKKAGYATNPTYPQQLIKLIVENNLQDYTLLAMHGKPEETDVAATDGFDKKSEIEESPSKTFKAQPVAVASVPVSKAGLENYPHNTVFSINDLKVIYAEAGTSLLAMANNYNVAYKKLLEFNDLDNADILTSNQLIFLQKKAKKGISDIHIVAANETIHDISQKEGMQLAALLEYNGLQKGMQPATGEKIYLKYAAPSSPKLAVAGKVKSAVNM